MSPDSPYTHIPMPDPAPATPAPKVTPTEKPPTHQPQYPGIPNFPESGHAQV